MATNNVRGRPNYILWSVGILVGDALLWPLFRGLGISPGATVHGLLLLDTLIVVAWYAHLTHQVAATSQRQFERRANVRSRSNRPCVVIEWRYVPPPRFEMPPGWTYVAKNIGSAVAVTSVWIENLDAEKPLIWHLGAVEPGGSIEIPQKLVQMLNDEAKNPSSDQKRHVVIAEPIGGEVWVVSHNQVEASGRLSHEISTMVPSDSQRQQIHREPSDAYIHRNWPAIQREMRAMMDALSDDKKDKAK